MKKFSFLILLNLHILLMSFIIHVPTKRNTEHMITVELDINT